MPEFPLAGMLNKSGGKVRLTFKLEQDQLWIGTKERTDKIPMNSIKGVHSEPIHDHPEYHIMACISLKELIVNSVIIIEYSNSNFHNL